MTPAVWMLFAYFALVLLAARLFSRKIGDLKDFFLAGRKLSAFPVALTFAASWFGAASTMGSINAFHDMGLSGAWQIVIPSLLCFVIITVFMARPVSRQPYLSQPEAVEVHYGRIGRLMLSLIILTSVSALVGSQMVAAGKVFQGVFGLDIGLATILCTLAVVAYSMLGGYFAVVVTDIVQLALIALGFAVLLGFIVMMGFDEPGAWAAFRELRPDTFWTWHHGWQDNLFLVFTFVLAWSIAPEMWQRMSSVPNERVAVRAGLLATAVMLVLFALVIAIGMLSPRLVGQSDAVLVDLALMIPDPVLGGFVLMAFVAAVTSTMDSSMNVGSLTLTRDIYQGWLRPQAGDAELVWVSRAASVLIAVPAIVIALAYQNIIQVLWISADIYASTMFFPVVGILYVRNPGRWSGILAMLFGGVSVVISTLVQHGWLPIPAWPGWPASTLLSVGLSGLGFAVGLWWSRRQAAVDTTSPRLARTSAGQPG